MTDILDLSLPTPPLSLLPYALALCGVVFLACITLDRDKLNVRGCLTAATFFFGLALIGGHNHRFEIRPSIISEAADGSFAAITGLTGIILVALAGLVTTGFAMYYFALTVIAIPPALMELYSEWFGKKTATTDSETLQSPLSPPT